MKETLINYLVINQPYIKTLCSDLITRKEHVLLLDPLFTDEIIEQFNSLIRQRICDEASKDLACDYETIMVELEEINLMEYLK